MIDALVLAGSPNNGQLKDCSSVAYEALIPIAQKPMVRYVVDALVQSKHINRIVIVGPYELQDTFSEYIVRIVKPEGKIMHNLYEGFKQLADSKRALIVTSDIPLLTTEVIDDFISLCGTQKSDLYFPVVPQKEVNNKFPTVQRTYVALKEGVFTGGNIFLVNPAVVSKCIEKGQQLIDLRKSPVKLCKMLGLKFLAKFLLKRLSLTEIEKKASSLLDIKGKAVICNNPEIGVDIDKPSDLALVIKNLVNINTN